MIGRQVTVRLGPGDRGLLKAEIRRRGGVLLPYKSEGPEILEPHEVEVLPDQDPPWIARRIDLPNISRYYVASQGYWLIDRHMAPVIQWGRVSPERHGIGDFRLYFAPQDELDGNWVELPADFVSWADGLLRWVRGRLHRVDGTSVFVGPEAEALDR